MIRQRLVQFPLILLTSSIASCATADPLRDILMPVRQITRTPEPHVLTNVNAFSPDGQWIVYDVRSDQGAQFDGDRIDRVNIRTGEVDVLYRAADGARCGVASYDPAHDRVAFILGPAHPTADFTYGAARRQGVMVDASTRETLNVDARDLSSPFTAGALRGGTHVHIFNARGDRISSTYEDHVLELLGDDVGHDLNQRTVAVSVLDHPVHVEPDHPRNHDGSAFSVVVTRTVNAPVPGSDEISRAFEEGWVGTDGYLRGNGTRQRDAIAFQGSVVTADGKTISEVFVVDLPEDLSIPSPDGPLEGTATRRPIPPKGTTQRRLTFTANRSFPGVQGPRHWLRSSPDGSQIAFLMKDDKGVAQFWSVSPNGGEPRQITHGSHAVQSAFTWSSDGTWLACVMDNSICVVDAQTGAVTRLTPHASDDASPRPIAAVFSPDGRSIAFVSPVRSDAGTFDQVFLVDVPAQR